MKDKVLLRVRFSTILVNGFHQDGFFCFGFSRDDRMVSGLDFAFSWFFRIWTFWFRIWIRFNVVSQDKVFFYWIGFRGLIRLVFQDFGLFGFSGFGL